MINKIQVRYVSPRADIREGVCLLQYTRNYHPAYQNRKAYVILLLA